MFNRRLKAAGLTVLILIVTAASGAFAGDLPLSDGDRILVIGDSIEDQKMWACYVAGYFVLQNPSLTLHAQVIARGGTSVLNWLDSGDANYEEYSKRAYPLQPKFVFTFSSLNGGLSEANHKAAELSLVQNYVIGESNATPIILGMMPNATLNGNSGGSGFDNANEQIATDPNHIYRYSKMWTLLSSVFTQHTAYTANAGTDTCTSNGHGLTDGMKLMVETSSSTPGGLARDTIYYVRDATTNTFKLAAAQGGSPIDITSSGSGTQWFSYTWPLLRQQPDESVHLNRTAHIAFAWKLITDQGFTAFVSTATIDANTRTVTDSNQCTITSVTANAYSGIDFNRLDGRLPWAIDEGTRDDLYFLYPSAKGWQDYSLKVTNLPSGTYDVLIDNVDVADVTSSELAAGWNMADLTAGPVWQQCQEVLGRIRDMQGVDRSTLAYLTNPWRGGGLYQISVVSQYLPPNNKRGQDLITAVQSTINSINAFDANIHTAAQPVTRSISIRLKSTSNQAPAVNAGNDLTISIDANAILDGNVIDDGLPNPPGAVAVQWTKQSGPGTVTFGDANAVDTYAHFSATGSYVLRLTADDSNKTAYDEATITVNAANQAPTVNAGNDANVTQPDSVSLDGTVSDDGLPNPPGALTTTWTKTSGPGTVTFADANAVDTTASFSATGDYVLRLTANDSNKSAYDEVTITVNATGNNQAPNVDAGSDASVTLSGQGGSGAGVLLLEDFEGMADGNIYGQSNIGRNPNHSKGWYTGGDPNKNQWMPSVFYTGSWKTDPNQWDDTFVYTSAGSMNYTSNDGSISINPGDKHIEANGINSLGKQNGVGFHNYTSANLGSGQSTLWISYLVKYTGTGNWDQSNGNMEEIWPGFNYVSGSATSLVASMAPNSGGGKGGKDAYAVFGSLSGAAYTFEANHPTDTNVHLIVTKWTTNGVSGDGNFRTVSLWVDPNAADLQSTPGGNATYTSTANLNNWAMNYVTWWNGNGFETNDQISWDRFMVSTSYADIIPSKATASLDGTVSDDGLPNPPAAVAVQWTKTSGPGPVSFADPNAVDTTATFFATGTYVLRLTANDGDAASYDEVTITVNDAGSNQTPTANAGNDKFVNLPSSVNLDGVVTDDGQPNPPGAATARWSKTSGPGTVTFGDANAAATTASFSQSGTYVLRLTADDSNKTAYDEMTVVANSVPTVNAGNDASVNRPGAAGLDGTVSDDGLPNPPGAVSATWTKTSGPGTVTFGDANAVDTTASFSASGTYVLRLTASDGNTSAYDEVTIKANDAPSVNAGNDANVTLPNSANLDGAVTDDGLPNPPGAVTAQWTKQSGPGTVTFGDANAVDTTASFSQSGTYVLRLTANDGSATAYDEVIINVTDGGNQAPNVNAGSDANVALSAQAPGGGVLLLEDFEGMTDGNIYGQSNIGRDPNHSKGWYTGSDPNKNQWMPSWFYTGSWKTDANQWDDVFVYTSSNSMNYTSNDGSIAINPGDKHIEANGINSLGKNYPAGFHNYTSANLGSGQSTLWISYIVRYTGAGNWDQSNGNMEEISPAFNYVSGNNSSLVASMSPNSGGGNGGKDVYAQFGGQSGTAYAFEAKHPTDSNVHLIVTKWTTPGTGDANFKTVSLWVDPNLADLQTTPGGNATYTSSAGLNNRALNYITWVNGNGFEANDQISWDRYMVSTSYLDILPSKATVNLDGTVADDGMPNPPAAVTTTWSKISGPGPVVFGDASAVDTTASFYAAGTYVLRLTAYDGDLTTYDEVTITVQ